MVTRARIASGPDLVSNTAPSTRSRPSTPLAKAWNTNCTPASSSSSSAISLNHSGSNGTTYPVASEGSMAPPALTSFSSKSLRAPAMIGSPGPWSVGSSVVAPFLSFVGCAVWKDMSGMTSAAVALPPRKPYRSASTTRAPACAAPSAAPSPAGPPPTTSTSVSAASNARRGGSSIRFGSSGRFREGIAALARVQQLQNDLVGLARALLQRRHRLQQRRAQLAPVVPRFVEVRAQPPRVHEVQRRGRQLEILEEAR